MAAARGRGIGLTWRAARSASAGPPNASLVGLVVRDGIRPAAGRHRAAAGRVSPKRSAACCSRGRTRGTVCTRARSTPAGQRSARCVRRAGYDLEHVRVLSGGGNGPRVVFLGGYGAECRGSVLAARGEFQHPVDCVPRCRDEVAPEQRTRATGGGPGHDLHEGYSAGENESSEGGAVSLGGGGRCLTGSNIDQAGLRGMPAIGRPTVRLDHCTRRGE